MFKVISIYAAKIKSFDNIYNIVFNVNEPLKILNYIIKLVEKDHNINKEYIVYYMLENQNTKEKKKYKIAKEKVLNNEEYNFVYNYYESIM